VADAPAFGGQIVRPREHAKDFRDMKTACSVCSRDLNCVGYFPSSSRHWPHRPDSCPREIFAVRTARNLLSCGRYRVLCALNCMRARSRPAASLTRLS
jgi:hypothetical protein